MLQLAKYLHPRLKDLHGVEKLHLHERNRPRKSGFVGILAKRPARLLEAADGFVIGLAQGLDVLDIPAPV